MAQNRRRRIKRTEKRSSTRQRSGTAGQRRRISHEDKKLYVRIGFILLVMILAVLGIILVFRPGIFSKEYREFSGDMIDASKPDIDVQLLTVNPYSRPGTGTNQITGIVVHYTANPGASAQNNRDYFESLKDTQDNKVSSNFVIGLEGEIIQCVPTWEVAYASNSRNIDTVSIECCHPDETGRFNEETYRSMVKLCAWLCMKFGLDETDVIRHYDVTGKNCPKYFVENEEAWETFRADIHQAMEQTELDEK